MCVKNLLCLHAGRLSRCFENPEPDISFRIDFPAGNDCRQGKMNVSIVSQGNQQTCLAGHRRMNRILSQRAAIDAVLSVGRNGTYHIAWFNVFQIDFKIFFFEIFFDGFFQKKPDILQTDIS